MMNGARYCMNGKAFIEIMIGNCHYIEGLADSQCKYFNERIQ